MESANNAEHYHCWYCGYFVKKGPYLCRHCGCLGNTRAEQVDWF